MISWLNNTLYLSLYRVFVNMYHCYNNIKAFLLYRWAVTHASPRRLHWQTLSAENNVKKWKWQGSRQLVGCCYRLYMYTESNSTHSLLRLGAGDQQGRHHVQRHPVAPRVLHVHWLQQDAGWREVHFAWWETVLRRLLRAAVRQEVHPLHAANHRSV